MFDAPRAMPLSRAIKTLNVKINDGSFSVPINDVITCFQRFYYKDYKNVYALSTTPTFLDESQSYDELTNTIRNPLAAYSNASFYGEPRGGHPGIMVLTNTSTQGVVNLRIVEPLFLSPFNWGHMDHPGFYGIQSMEIQVTFDTNLAACLWSHAPGGSSTFSNISVAIANQPQLLFQYLSPSLVDMMPSSCVYPYYSVDRYVTDVGSTLAPGASTTLYSNNIQLNSHPKRVYVYARQRNNDWTITSTDTFARINNITISYSNKAGLLSAATPAQLYQISRKNGCDMSWGEWFGTYGTNTPRAVSGVGGVFCFEVSSDIGIDDVSAVGQLENIQLQLNVNITNINPTTSINYSVYIVVISEGTITITQNRCISQIGVISRNDVLQMANMPALEYHVEVASGSGGDFFGAVKNVLAKAAPLISKALPYAQMACEGLKAVTGQGVLDTDESIGGARHRRHHKKHHHGRGGAMLSRSDLRAMNDEQE
jgi:hypothetical protein